MNRTLYTLLAGLALLAPIALYAPAATASDAIARETGHKCLDCHDKAGSKLLTDAGKYYETMHTFAGLDSLQATFGRCTACHARKPGSKKLTKRGKEYALLVHDMPALGELMRTRHPNPSTH